MSPIGAARFPCVRLRDGRDDEVLKNGVLYDAQDRVQFGAALIRDLMAMKPG